MKKITLKLILSALIVYTGAVYAQTHEKGQINLNVGIGLGNNIIGAGYTRASPPLSISGEYGVTDDISVGAYLGFTGATYQYTGWEDCYNNGNGFGNRYSYVDKYKWTYLLIGARGSYHFGKFIKVDKLDVYAGLMLGEDFAHSSYSTTSPCADHLRYNSPTYGGFAYSIYGGARYRFTEHFGVFGELGYGISYLNIGFNFKF